MTGRNLITATAARDLATDVAYVAGLAITANHGRLTCPIGSSTGRAVATTHGAVEVRVVIPNRAPSLEDHRREVDTAVAELERHAVARVVDRYAPCPNAATSLRLHVQADSGTLWEDLASRATPTFAHDRAEA